MNRISIVFITVLFVSATSFGIGTLQIGEPTVEGNQVVVPVILGGDTQAGVSALDFRLHYNPEVLQPVSASAGAAAVTADKQVMANVSTPGEYIVVMMGMNQTTCASGEVVKVVMQRTADAQDTQWSLGIRRPTLSAQDGTAIKSEALPYEPASKRETPAQPKTPNAPPQNATTAKAAGTTDEPVIAEYTVPGEAPEAPAAASDPQERLKLALADKDRARAQIDAPGLGRPSEDDEEQTQTTGNSVDAAKATPGNTEDPTRASRDTTPQVTVMANVANDAQTVEAIAKPSGGDPGGPVRNPVDSRAVTPDQGHGRAIVAVAVIAVLGGIIGMRRRLFG